MKASSSCIRVRKIKYRFAPWLEGYIGEKEYGVFRVLKNYFDPDYNMNPGGTIGLDLKPEEKKFLRDYTDYLEQPKFD